MGEIIRTGSRPASVIMGGHLKGRGNWVFAIARKNEICRFIGVALLVRVCMNKYICLNDTVCVEKLHLEKTSVKKLTKELMEIFSAIH